MIWDFALFTNIHVFFLLMILLMSVIGMFSRNGTMGLMGGYMTFVYIGSESTLGFYNNALYLWLILLILGTAFITYDNFMGGS